MIGRVEAIISVILENGGEMGADNYEVNYQVRQGRLVEAMGEAGLQGMAFNAGPSLTYLTGLHFHLSERPVVGLFTADNPPILILPELETGKLEHLSYTLKGFAYGENPDSWWKVFQNALRAADIHHMQVGIEPSWMRVLELNFLENAGPEINFVPGDACVAGIRIRKDESEISAMQKAVNIAQNALQSALPVIKPGITEKELAAEISVQLLRHGSNPPLPFTPIVASGPNSANPHAFPGDRRMKSGDLVIVDWGANVDGYFSDLTRTFAIGEPDDEMKAIARIVNQANSAARETAGPGVTAHEVDQAARRVIEDAGYGQYFIHRTGHGLGLETHEPPYIRDGNPISLEPGMSFTIEPGIYINGRGGVRIEDDVLITENGLRSFSDLSRELINL